VTKQRHWDVLVVEDSDAKRDSIGGALTRAFPLAEVRYALSVRSAIDELMQRTPDAIVADMSLPTYDIEDREKGGTPRPFGGIEVFEHLARHEIAVPVLVVTSYEAITDGKQSLGLTELSAKLGAEFPDCFIGTVYFDSTYSTWEKEICDHLQTLLGG
jgi:CheY-like chemotaxis protein